MSLLQWAHPRIAPCVLVDGLEDVGAEPAAPSVDADRFIIRMLTTCAVRACRTPTAPNASSSAASPHSPASTSKPPVTIPGRAHQDCSGDPRPSSERSAAARARGGQASGPVANLLVKAAIALL